MLHNPELRLKARSSQDRGDTLARTTDKGFQNGRIYSLISHDKKMKCELTQMAKVQYVDKLYVDFKPTLIDLEIRQDNKGQAKAA